MTVSELIHLRLNNQQVSATRFAKPADVVKWMGAVQSQDFAAAKWALGLRLQNFKEKDIEQAFNKGEILRTHVMRPTWHFVAPEDIHWLQNLTGPRVIATINNSGKKIGLDETVFRKSNKLIAKALAGGKHLTREEMETILNKEGIVTGDLHMIHLMMRAELDGLICSGPRKGKQFTYALLEDRVPVTKKLTHDEALAELTKRYFLSHGPATLQDYVWWSGLKVTDAKKGLDLVKSGLVHETTGAQEYWFSASAKATKENDSSAFLLPAFDEYTVSYKDRNLLVDSKKVKEMPGPIALLSNTIVVDGRVVGTWKRAFRKDGIEVTASHLHALHKSKLQRIVKAAERYGKFYGLPVTISRS